MIIRASRQADELSGVTDSVGYELRVGQILCGNCTEEKSLCLFCPQFEEAIKQLHYKDSKKGREEGFEVSKEAWERAGYRKRYTAEEKDEILRAAVTVMSLCYDKLECAEAKMSYDNPDSADSKAHIPRNSSEYTENFCSCRNATNSTESTNSTGTTFGATHGVTLGTTLGAALGTTLDSTLGTTLGATLGSTLGATLGTTLGTTLGATLGTTLGTSLGTTLCLWIASAVVFL